MALTSKNNFWCAMWRKAVFLCSFFSKIAHLHVSNFNTQVTYQSPHRLLCVILPKATINYLQPSQNVCGHVSVWDTESVSLRSGRSSVNMKQCHVIFSQHYSISKFCKCISSLANCAPNKNWMHIDVYVYVDLICCHKHKFSSIQPSVHGSQQNPKAAHPRHFVQLLQGGPGAFPDQVG